MPIHGLRDHYYPGDFFDNKECIPYMPHRGMPLHSSLGIGPDIVRIIQMVVQNWLDEHEGELEPEIIAALRSFYKKFEGSFVTTEDITTFVTIPINGYRRTDILFVDINGLDLVEDVDYTKQDNMIRLVDPIEGVGQTIHFVALRAVVAQATDYETLKGDKGDKGDQGEKGDKGDKGDVGTTDYEELENIPYINDVQLVGEQTLESLGLLAAFASKLEAIKSIVRSGTMFTVTRTDDTTFTFDQQDNDTWIPNSDDDPGYVAAGSGHANKVWKTDADGNPGWRDDDNTTYALATPTSNGLMSASDKEAIASLITGSVIGVKGDRELDYRTGNINLTPANIGASPDTHKHAIIEMKEEFQTVNVQGTTYVSISSLNYNPNRDVLHVYINGLKLTQLEYTVLDQYTIALANSIAPGNMIEVVALKVWEPV